MFGELRSPKHNHFKSVMQKNRYDPKQDNGIEKQPHGHPSGHPVALRAVAVLLKPEDFFQLGGALDEPVPPGYRAFLQDQEEDCDEQTGNFQDGRKVLGDFPPGK